MAFQTFENDENNSGQIKRKNLKNEIRSTWLGMVDVFQEEITSMLEGLPHLVWT